MKCFVFVAMLIAVAAAAEELMFEERELCRKEATETPEPRCITEVTEVKRCARAPCRPGKRIEDGEHEIIETRFECRRGMDSCEVVEEKKRDCVHKNFCGPTSGGTGKRSIASKRCVKVGACGQGKRELPCVNCEQNKGKRELAAEDEEMVVIETQKKCSREVGERELCTREVTKREVTKRGCDRANGPGKPPCIPKKKGKRIEDEEHEIIETRFECRRGINSCEVVEEKKRDCVHKNFCGPTSGGSGKRSIASKRCVACPQNKGRK